VDIAARWRAALADQLKASSKLRRFRWELQADADRVAPKYLADVYGQGRRMKDHILRRIMERGLEEAHEVDAVTLAAAALDELFVSDNVAVLSSATAELLARRLQTFENGTVGVKGMEAFKKNGREKLKKEMGKLDVAGESLPVRET